MDSTIIIPTVAVENFVLAGQAIHQLKPNLTTRTVLSIINTGTKLCWLSTFSAEDGFPSPTTIANCQRAKARFQSALGASGRLGIVEQLIVNNNYYWNVEYYPPEKSIAEIILSCVQSDKVSSAFVKSQHKLSPPTANDNARLFYFLRKQTKRNNRTDNDKAPKKKNKSTAPKIKAFKAEKSTTLVKGKDFSQQVDIPIESSRSSSECEFIPVTYRKNTIIKSNTHTQPINPPKNLSQPLRKISQTTIPFDYSTLKEDDYAFNYAVSKVPTDIFTVKALNVISKCNKIPVPKQTVFEQCAQLQTAMTIIDNGHMTSTILKFGAKRTYSAILNRVQIPEDRINNVQLNVNQYFRPYLTSRLPRTEIDVYSGAHRYCQHTFDHY